MPDLESKKRKKNLFIRLGIIALGIFVVVGFIYGLELLNKRPQGIIGGGLPESFLSAYKEASVYGGRMVDLVNSVNDKVEQVNDLDLGGDTGEALDLIDVAREESEKARNEALELAERLAGMTRAVGDIASFQDQQIALEAIILETKLIWEFIDYTKNLEDFLKSLSIAVVTDSTQDRQEAHRQLNFVNERSRTINALNNQFLAHIGILGI